MRVLLNVPMGKTRAQFMEMLPGPVHLSFKAAISDVAHPTWRATFAGGHRRWRDLGYAVATIMAGLVADLPEMGAAFSRGGAHTAGVVNCGFAHA